MTPQDRGVPVGRWVLVLLASGVLYWLVLLTMMVTGNSTLFPTLLLLGALVAPATLLMYVNWWQDRVLVSGRLVLWVALLSGVLSVMVASILEFASARQREAWPMLTVAVIEETLKLLVPLGVFLAGLAPDRRAGVVVGIASGAGFAVLETMGYGFTALLRTGTLQMVDQTLLVRGVLAPAGHLAWTGILVAALWALRTQHAAYGIARLVAAYVLVVLLHAAWDTFDAWPVRVVIALTSLALLLVLVHRSRRPAPMPAPALS